MLRRVVNKQFSIKRRLSIYIVKQSLCTYYNIKYRIFLFVNNWSNDFYKHRLLVVLADFIRDRIDRFTRGLFAQSNFHFVVELL